MPAYKLYIFDLDGTLYRGDQVLPEAVAALKRIRAAGHLVRFLTNNSSTAIEAVAAKLNRMGYEASPEEVTTSATATATFLKAQGIETVQCLGEAGLVETLRKHGLQAVGPEADWEKPAEAVAAGIFRQLTYPHLAKAMTAIRAGARFIATNADATYPMEGDHLIPGAGSIIAALRTCSETEPFVIGKPNPYITHLVLEEAGVSASETLVVGDRMDTDIESGIAAGCQTLLVLTGVAKTAPPGQPFAKNLDELLT